MIFFLCVFKCLLQKSIFQENCIINQLTNQTEWKVKLDVALDAFLLWHWIWIKPITVEFKRAAWGCSDHNMPLLCAPLPEYNNSDYWSVKDYLPKAAGQFSPLCESISVGKSYHVVRSLLRTQDRDEIEPKAISPDGKNMWIPVFS